MSAHDPLRNERASLFQFLPRFPLRRVWTGQWPINGNTFWWWP